MKRLLLICCVALFTMSCRSVSKISSSHKATSDASYNKTTDSAAVHKMSGDSVSKTTDSSSTGIIITLDPDKAPAGDSGLVITVIPIDPDDYLPLDSTKPKTKRKGYKITVPGNTTSVQVNIEEHTEKTDSVHTERTDSSQVKKTDTGQVKKTETDKESSVKKCGFSFAGALLVLGIVVLFFVYWRYFRHDRPKPL